MNNLPNWLQSSTDPTQVSSRVTGIVIGASSIIMFLAARFFHITLSADDMVSLASELGALAGAIWTIKGFIIWVLTKFGKKTV